MVDLIEDSSVLVLLDKMSNSRMMLEDNSWSEAYKGTSNKRPIRIRIDKSKIRKYR